MLPKIPPLFSILLLGLPAVSLAFVPPALAATGYVGNDDAEFGFPSTQCAYLIGDQMSAQAALSAQMTYTSSNGYVSMQYNPDLDVSKNCQTGPWYGGADWFQTGIIGVSSSNCAIFTTQVYNTLWGTTDYSWYSNNQNCTTVSAMFNSRAQWYISEHSNACLTNCGSSFEKIDAVSFSVVGGSGGGSYYYTVYPPTNWYWLRSNICWCGTGGQSATFTSASGKH